MSKATPFWTWSQQVKPRSTRKPTRQLIPVSDLTHEEIRKLFDVKLRPPYDSPPITCPHCGLVGRNPSAMKRYHFDGCRSILTPEQWQARQIGFGKAGRESKRCT